MPIYVHKKIVGGENKFYGKAQSPNGLLLYTTDDLANHPQPSVQVYILNDGNNPSATLTISFLYRLYTQWLKRLKENFNSGSPATGSMGDINGDGVVDILDAAIVNATAPKTPIFRFLVWQVSTDNGITYQDMNTGVNLFNSDTWKLVLNNLSVQDNGKRYRCVVGLQDYTLVSKEAQLSVAYWPSITTTNGPVTTAITSQPNDTIAGNDGTAEFGVVASAPEGVSLQYEWQVSVNNGMSFTNVSSGTTSTLSLSSLTREDHNKIYRVRVYRPDPPGVTLPIAYSSIFSKHARLLTQAEFDIITHPQNTTSSNGNAQFSVVIAPTHKIIFSANYQWQVSKDNGISYTDIAGATASVLNLSGLLVNDHNSLYRVRISSACCGTESFIRYSNAARLYTVNSTIVFEKQPVSLSSINSEATFTAGVRSLCPTTCGPVLYQWAYVTGTSADPIYTIIEGETLDYLTLNVITNDKKKFALIASQPQTNSIIISNTVTLTNLNSKPTDIFLSKNSILENNSIGDTIGTLSTQDLNTDGTYTYSLLDTFPDYSLFTIDGNTLKANGVFDYSSQPSYTIAIRSTDQGGLYVDKVFYIYVRTNVTISLGNTINSLPENTPVTTDIKVADIRVTDPFDGEGFLSEDDIFLLGPSPLSLTGTDANFFKIDGLSLKLKSGTILNYETKLTYIVTVNLNPPEEMSTPSSINFTLNIEDVNENPSNIILFPNTILEGNKINDVIGSFITIDPDINQNFTYSLVTNTNPSLSADNASFTISPGSNDLKANSVFNWTTKRTHKITVRTTDTGTPPAFFDKALEITILKRPTPPPPPPGPPKPPDSVGGDPHYYITAYSGKKYQSIIDDNIGGGPVIGMYIKIEDEEWKAVFTNTPGIVCSLDNITFFYRKSSNTWTSTSELEYNKNGCFIISGSLWSARFFWNNPYELIKRDNLIVGGFLYWLQKGIEANNNQAYNSYWPDRMSYQQAIQLGIDGITEVVSQFGLKRDDFLANKGDANLFKITEKFNIFSDKVES